MDQRDLTLRLTGTMPPPTRSTLSRWLRSQAPSRSWPPGSVASPSVRRGLGAQPDLYPPDKQESAVVLVMQQAELFAAEVMTA